MDRVVTGIKGFDGLVEGGFPLKSNMLITGMPGTGKTIFGLEYLYKGAEMGENGLFVSLDSSLEMIRTQAKLFGWDFESMEKSGKIFLFKVPLDRVKFNLFDMIEKISKEINAKRMVFDNLAALAINIDLFPVPMNSIEGEEAVSSDGTEKKAKQIYVNSPKRRTIYHAIEKFEELGTTNLIITYGSNTAGLTVDGVSEFACDGIIELYNELIGNKRIRTLSISKMRDTNHSQYIHEFEFSKEGIIVKPAEELYK